jgi:class 3 adenylate cyclase
MLRVDIRDFVKSTRNMTYDEIFTYLNTYLDYISPLIRKHGGFIDRYDGSVFLALFTHQRHASNACLDIQKATSLFNQTTKFPTVHVGMSIHSGSVLVGTVGEELRMQGTILSHHLNTSVLLERLARKFQTSILTTCIAKKMHYRNLGHVNIELPTGATDKVKIYELLQDSSTQNSIPENAVIFSEAISKMEEGKFSEALKTFNRMTTLDDLAMKYQNWLVKAQELCRSIQSEIKLAQVLSDGKLQQNFQDFCQNEHSKENVLLWNSIQRYKQIQSSDERRQAVSEMNEKYLLLNGLYTVNINERLKKRISDELENNSSEFSVQLFDEIQIELELVMKDSFKRFRDSELQCYMIEQSTLAPEIPSLEDL